MSFEDDHLDQPEVSYWYGVRLAFSTVLLLTDAPFDVVLPAAYGGTTFGAETFSSSTEVNPQELAESDQGQQESSISVGNADGVIGAAVLAASRAPEVDVFRFWFDEIQGAPGTTLVLREVRWLVHGVMDRPGWDPDKLSFSLRPVVQGRASQLPAVEMAPRCSVRSFKDAVCGYTGGETQCDRTKARCVELANLENFQAFLDIPPPGFVISVANGIVTIGGPRS